MAALRRLLCATCLVAATSAFSCTSPLLRVPVHSVRLASPIAASGDEATAPAVPGSTWFEDGDAATGGDSAPAAEIGSSKAPEPPTTTLALSDLTNTKWKLSVTPRPDGWLGGGVQDQEVTLLDDGSVVWGGTAGGFGTGGRWQLQETVLEVIRTTPLGLVTGRDYYMMAAQAEVTDNLQFELNGVIRSYNALYPVSVIADFVAVRQPGRFIRDSSDDDE